MCQMSVFIEENGDQKVIMENVTLLESVDGDVCVSSLFDQPVHISSVFVKKIDFSGGTVILSRQGGGSNG